MDALERIADDPVTSGIWEHLLQLVQQLGPVTVDGTRASVQVSGRRAFLWVHPRRASLVLNIALPVRLASVRSRRQQQVSRARWHNEVLVTTSGELDDELMGWIEEAFSSVDPRKDD